MFGRKIKAQHEECNIYNISSELRNSSKEFRELKNLINVAMDFDSSENIESRDAILIRACELIESMKGKETAKIKYTL